MLAAQVSAIGLSIEAFPDDESGLRAVSNLAV